MLKITVKNSGLVNKYPSKWIMASILLAASNSVNALTAKEVMTIMDDKQQHSYIAGIVGGIAYSRFLRERPDETGMQCVYDWFYESGPDKWIKIDQWFNRHVDKPAEALLYVLIKRKCGE